MQPGTILQTRSGTLFEYVREGCATNLTKCSREHPITVISLTRAGKRRFGYLTLCYEASELAPADGWV